MPLHPRVTPSLIELVKRFEGLRRRAARLPSGGWTIGYGHTLSAREGAAVTPEDAEALLYYDLNQIARRVEAWVFTPLTQNQFEALCALAFNIGLEPFRRSTVLRRVNEGQMLLAAAAFELWRRAELDGRTVVVDALVRRRAAEKAHFLTPDRGFTPSPTPVLQPRYDEEVVRAAGMRLRSLDSPGTDRSILPAEAPNSLHGPEAPEASVDALERADAPRAPAPSVSPASTLVALKAPEDLPFAARTVEVPALEPRGAEADRPFPGLVRAPAEAPPPPVEDRRPLGGSSPVPSLGEASFGGAAAAFQPAPRRVASILRGPPAYAAAAALGLVLTVIAVATLVLGRAGTGNLLAGLFGISLLTLGGAYFVRRARREAAARAGA